MRFRILGRTGLRVSALAFGAGPVSGLMTGDDHATQASALEHPITVASVNRPDWVEAVVREPGVLSLSLADALATYARA